MAAAAVLIALGVLASKVSDRFGIPALLLFLVIGMLAGSEGIGGIDFDDAELAQGAGVVALAFILFAGGLDTDWASVRPVLRHGLLLATVGVLGTAIVVGLVASVVLDLSWTEGMLLGSIVSSTDAAAVFAVLRSRSVSLKGTLRPLLELESGSNDPMAAFLTVAFLELVTDPGRSVLPVVPLFFAQMGLGAAVGYLLARVSVVAINRARLGYDGLYPVMLIAVVLLTYGAAALVRGSGFLAVYVAGLVMGNARFVHKRSLMRFADGLAWLMQIAMFLLLGLLVFPSDLWPVAGRALLVAAALMLVARPAATFLIVGLGRYGLRRTMLVSWVGLRGAVPIVLATFPLVEGVDQADLIFNVVFFIVILSVLVQGTTIPLVARWLGVDAPLPRRRPDPLAYVESGDASTAIHEIDIPEDAPASGRRLVDLALPDGALVVLVSRGEDFVVPQGSTLLQAGDTVLLLADEASLPAARAQLLGDR
jgi:cell volume regulation protein A